MDHEQLIEEVRSRMGGGDDQTVARAIDATLEALSLRLICADAERVARALPLRFAAVLRGGMRDPAMDLAAFYQRVAEREGVQPGAAMEHAQAVCAALMQLLDHQARAQLRIHLWPELLVGSVGDRYAERHRPRGRTLATGRPGPRHPISESPPPDRAHRESVVRSDNPHGERKLSSAH